LQKFDQFFKKKWLKLLKQSLWTRDSMIIRK
jgi:hypothetical protein